MIKSKLFFGTPNERFIFKYSIPNKKKLNLPTIQLGRKLIKLHLFYRQKKS